MTSKNERFGGEQLVLGALDVRRVDVAKVLAHELGLGLELVLDEEPAEDQLRLDGHRVEVVAGAMRHRQHVLSRSPAAGDARSYARRVT